MDVHVPPALMTSESRSFARDTIVERKPRIIAQVSADNDYPLAHEIRTMVRVNYVNR